MNGVNLEKLVALVRPNVEKQDTNQPKAIPIEKCVGVALWRLATGNSFRSVAKSTAVKITHDCMIWISSNFITFPQSQIETATAMELFKSGCNCKIPPSFNLNTRK